jgi:hypothetical protein
MAFVFVDISVDVMVMVACSGYCSLTVHESTLFLLLLVIQTVQKTYGVIHCNLLSIFIVLFITIRENVSDLGHLTSAGTCID